MSVEYISNLDGDNRPYANVSIGQKQIQGLLDSGANCTILGKGALEFIKANNLKQHTVNTVLKTADSTNHTANSYVNLPIRFKNKTRTVATLVVPSLSKGLILGMDFWNIFDIKPVCGQIDLEITDSNRIELSSVQEKQLADAIANLKASVPNAPLNRTHLVEHKIDTGDATPIKQRYYPVSPYVQKEMDEELQRMLDLGVIEKSSSSWSNPIVGVRKPNGKLRLCLDSRRLNAVSKTDAFPLPYISRILGRLRGTKYLSSIDLSDAFWQIPLAQADKGKTAFTLPGRGLFQFISLPFGLHGAAQSLCRLMDSVLGYDLEPYVHVYLDDILICTDTFEEHLSLIKEVGKRLQQANLSISRAKSKFCMRKLNYLGYVIDEKGINVNPDKISAIVNYPTPTSVREVRRLLGMVSWYRRFIPNFASVSGSITDLLKGKPTKKFVWTSEAESAFNDLKLALISAPVLKTPDFTKPFIIQTDASDRGVGAVLVQGEGENEGVINYMSQKLSDTQIKYSTTEKECLAVILAIEKFRPYIEGVRFTVISDHASLQWLMNVKDPTGRLARWALRLQAHDYSIQHRKGKLMVVADALSRSVETIDISTGTFNGDPWYESLKEKIEMFPADYGGFIVKDGFIYKFVGAGKSRSSFAWKLVIPSNIRDKILHENHDVPLASHAGSKKTLARIQSRFYWPKMAKDVVRYVKICEVCQATKHSTVVLKGEMVQPKDPGAPWQMIALDLAGPLPRSKKGHNFLLVVMDVFSKFVLLHPLKNATSAPILKFLEENVFLMFGCPSVVIQDNGPQLTSKSYREFMSNYGIKLWYNAYYTPQTNPAERVIQTTKTAIRAYVQENHREWDKYLPQVGCALRTAVHDSTKFTPYFTNFGQEMASTGDMGNLDDALASLENKKDRLATLKEIREQIKVNMAKAYANYAKGYNLRTRKIEFKVGDFVLKRNFTLSSASKGYTAGLGPVFIKCKVKEKVGRNCYRLQDLNKKDIGVYHMKDLKQFY